MKIVKFDDGLYAVRFRFSDIFLATNGITEWHDPIMVKKYCTLRSLQEAEDLVYAYRTKELKYKIVKSYNPFNWLMEMFR